VSEAWGFAGTAVGAVAMVVAGLFAARASSRATAATAEATRAAATVAAEPDQRKADLEAFRVIRDDMQQEIREMRTDMSGLRALVRSLGRAYEGLWRWAQNPVGDPPEPEDRVKDYLRTGV
jgi:hypothetical protein